MEKKFNKQSLKNLIKGICFLLVFAVLLSLGYKLLEPRNNTAAAGIESPNARGFYSVKQNTIDITVIGNSDAYSGYSPMELWHNYGYTSYVSGEASQRLASSVKLLKEMLKYQSPKIVFLETDALYTKGDRLNDTLLVSLGEIIPLFSIHNRWKTFRVNDLYSKTNYTGDFFAKGQKMSNATKPYTGPEYMKYTEKVDPMPYTSKIYLDNFVSLCKEKNLKLILLEMPSKSSWTYAKHNSVANYAKENHLTFIDADLERSKFDFDWKTDSRDGGNHLNTRGARKMTKYLGKYLSQNFNLTDHRKDSDFENWNKDYKKYAKAAKI